MSLILPLDLPAIQLLKKENIIVPLCDSSHGVNTIEQAFELKPQREATLMFTKHCLLYSMGICVKNQLSSSSFHQPYFLVYKDLKYRLKFDCSNCQMLIAKENK